jgi:hypothetical protein
VFGLFQTLCLDCVILSTTPPQLEELEAVVELGRVEELEAVEELGPVEELGAVEKLGAVEAVEAPGRGTVRYYRQYNVHHYVL